MLKFFKKKIISIINFFGYEITHKSLKLQHSFFNLPQTIFEKKYNKKKDKLVIFDIGAHFGESVSLFSKIINKFKLEFHCFEPNEKSFKELCNNYKNKENIIFNNFALGNKNGRKNFFIFTRTGASSFLKVNKKSKWFIKRNKPKLTSEILVKVETLDKYIKKNSIKRINLLKIDTQGAELDVLIGARNALKKNLIDLIDTSVLIGDVYEKKFNVYDFEKILIPFGYKLVGIQSEGQQISIISRPHLELRLIYCKKKIFDLLI